MENLLQNSEDSLSSSSFCFSLTTTGLVATLLVLYLLDRGHLSSTRRRLRKLRRTIWTFLSGGSFASEEEEEEEEEEERPKLDRPTAAGVRNALGQLVSSIYTLPEAPSPSFRLPVLGHLHLLAAYPTNPWEGFNAIRRRYGSVVRLQLGAFRSVLVSSTEAIREVLLLKGDAFADRPHFERHAIIFGRNRQNALALCDWSDIHKSRRSIAHAAVIPRFGTVTFHRLADSIQGALGRMLGELKEKQLQNLQTKNDDDNVGVTLTLDKDRLLRLCGAIFVHFLLEKEVAVDSAAFKEVTDRYDFIFYDINQMYLCDFLPFLAPVTARRYLGQVAANSAVLMKFINDQVIERYEQLVSEKKVEEEIVKEASSASSSSAETSEKTALGTNNLDQQQQQTEQQQTEQQPTLEAKYDEKSCDERFVDRLLLHKQYQSSAQFLDFILRHYLENRTVMTWDEALYEIADLVGGNSAVANLLVRLLGHLALNPEVQQQLYEEAVSVLAGKPGEAVPGTSSSSVPITLQDQSQLPLTNAAIMETLRLASSPIVPHLARYDTSIAGYLVPKGTMVLFNVYHLNLSSDLWPGPDANGPLSFRPSRFVTPEGNVLKPDYFFPFSHGRRSCLGYKMVNTVLFSTVANLLLGYRIEAGSEANRARMTEMLAPKGSIALPCDGSCYDLTLVPRS